MSCRLAQAARGYQHITITTGDYEAPDSRAAADARPIAHQFITRLCHCRCGPAGGDARAASWSASRSRIICVATAAQSPMAT